MDINTPKKTLHTVTFQSNLLAKQAKREMRLTGQVTIKCPLCNEKPQIIMTSRGKRTIVSCKCGHVYDAEINF